MPEEKKEIERRFVQITQRAAGDEENPIIEGDAAVFNKETQIGDWFREKIRMGAFSRVLSEKPDVLASYNHNWNVVLGRTTAGTLKLEETLTGLRYSVAINPKDTEAMNVYAKVKRGDISQASFAFTVRREEWTKPASKKELALREVIEVDKLFDVGPVAFGAYPQASAQARSLAETLQHEEPNPTPQAESSGSEEAVKARQAARRRTLELLDA